MNGHYRLWKNLMQKKSKESEEIITMIIDNVKVYTESGEFILGGIITQGDTITAVYTEKEKEVTLKKMNMTADSSVQKEKLTENVIDGKGAYAIPGLIDLHFDVWGMTFVMETKKRFAVLQSTKQALVLLQLLQLQ